MNGDSQNASSTTAPSAMSSQIETLCGPLLNYRRMSDANGSKPVWHGSVLIVTKPQQQKPSLSLRCIGAVKSSTTNGASTANGVSDGSSNQGPTDARDFAGEKLYEDHQSCFWRFRIELPLQSFESQWQYQIPNLHYVSQTDNDQAGTKTFVVPPIGESMRIMFHSCNGFSVGTDREAWPGCTLWSDVVRRHNERPLHVMIGGGDQIYNDSIRVDGPLQAWTSITNPVKRKEYPFDNKLRADCDDYYFNNYLKWFATEPFASANGIIPQLNIWDDHDIIDGFGSYVDPFMKCAVFRGIGGVALKYYLLFQHHAPPPETTFTTGADRHSTPQSPPQAQQSFVLKEKEEDPSYLFGSRPGPYVEERSRSIYCELGASIAFLGIDARTERTRHQVNYPETYDMLFNHVSSQIAKADGRIKHFILLLGIPVAYPRLQWLENILHSPAIGLVRFMSKRFGIAGGLFNNFDGSVDLLDDLDDHYTAHQHKRERKELVLRLQRLALDHSVRVTILGGDVHLGACGRFYSNPSAGTPVEEDHRYMVNVISSAITNHPPPQAVANLLARRNKIHHLDHHTDETLLNLFDIDPSKSAPAERKVAAKSADANHCTMPSRNFAIIAATGAGPAASGAPVGSAANGSGAEGNGLQPTNTRTHDPSQLQHHNHSNKSENPRSPLCAAEDECGSKHPAAEGTRQTGRGGPHGLDVTYRVEIDPTDLTGQTVGYGLSIPSLSVNAERVKSQGVRELLKKEMKDVKDNIGIHGADKTAK